MDGRSHACGAVAGTTIARNPISLARLVMTDTRHVLLAAGGADAFATEKGVPVVPRDYFVTEDQKQRWEKARNTREGASIPSADRLADRIGTVGCVALDRHGNLAAGTSTGGLVMKKFGRVGDSPIVGAGTYADNASCAVSCTGVGEEFIRHAIAYDISAQMKYAGTDLKAAVSKNLTQTLKPDYGGIIALDHKGNIVMDYNTKGMACAAADSSGRFEVRWPRGKAQDSQSR
jgi:beta-aspartyl-peptidase (threonine type)